jgi:hypothetical protein
LRLFDDREDVAFAHEEVFLVVDFDRLGGVAGEQDAVAAFHLHLAAGAVVEQLAGADGDDRAAAGLVLGGVGNVDAAGGLCLRLLALDDDLIAQGLERNLALLLRGGSHGSTILP